MSSTTNTSDSPKRIQLVPAPVRGQAPAGPAVLHKGFRPFFLLAAAYAAAFLPVWLLQFAGYLALDTYWSGPMWHAHEMLYGFTVAVIAGFLLTAAANWTGRETAAGPLLGALCALWVVGRIGLLSSGWLPDVVVACLDLAFLPALAFVLARPILATKNLRNAPFLVILGLLWVANLVMHLEALGLLAGVVRPAMVAALDLVILIALIIAGRIVPLFTRNATSAPDIRSIGWLDRLTLGGMAAVIALTVLAPQTAVTGVVTLAVGAAALGRMAFWGWQHTLRTPLLWVLHAGHAWIGIGLVLRGLSALTPAVTASAANHALTAGAIGTLTLGMMARVALGHTGRTLKVGRATAAAFVLISLAVLARVVVPMAAPELYMDALTVAGVLWSVAFGIYLLVYFPVLTRPRADGRLG